MKIIILHFLIFSSLRVIVIENFSDYDENTVNITINEKNITNIGSNIQNFRKLQILDLSKNKIKTIPETIKTITTLKTLNLSENLFDIFPLSICKIKNLNHLGLSSNKIQIMPNEIGELKQLLSLHFNHNRLLMLPKEVGALFNLRLLDLSYNMLKEIPITVRNLIKLRVFSIFCNDLKELPADIKNLTSLMAFSASGNRLTSIDPIKNLKKLRVLGLSFNQISILPEEIVNMDKLISLFITNNYLRFLPKDIGKLSNLKYLYLCNNQLTSIPKSILKLKRTILKLDLRENTINFYGDENNLGVSELIYHFENRVILEEYLIQEQKNISIDEIILKLSKKPIYWNFEKIKSLIPREVQETDISYNEIKNIWNNSLYFKTLDKIQQEFAFFFKDKVFLEIIKKIYDLKDDVNMYDLMQIVITAENDNLNLNLSDTDLEIYNKVYKKTIDDLILKNKNITLMEQYIHHIFNPEDVYERWHMLRKFIPIIKNMLCKILEILSYETDVDVVVSCIDWICEGIVKCPDRQKAEIESVYNLLSGTSLKEDSLENYIESIVLNLKINIFNNTFTPKKGRESVHVLNYWKYKLRNYIGTGEKFFSNFGTFREDIFKGNLKLAFQTFYYNFTPELLINNLEKEINGNAKILCKAAEFLYLNNINEKDMFISETNDILDTNAITKQFAKYILIYFDYIKENKL